eukprot:ctg_325.g94
MTGTARRVAQSWPRAAPLASRGCRPGRRAVWGTTWTARPVPHPRGSDSSSLRPRGASSSAGRRSGCCEQTPLQHLIVGVVDAGHDQRRREGDLLVLQKLVVAVAVQHHAADRAHRKVLLGPLLGVVQHVAPREMIRSGSLVHGLDVERPLRVVAAVDGVDEVMGGVRKVISTDHNRLVVQQVFDAARRAPVELDIGRLAVARQQSERVHAAAAHVAVVARDALVVVQKREHIQTLRVMAQKVQNAPALLPLGARVRFESVNEVGELDGIADEEHRKVVAHQIPDALARVKLDGETAWVPQRLRRVAGVNDGGEAHCHRGATADFTEHVRTRQVGDVVRHLKITLGHHATRVHHPLRLPLTVKIGQLLQQMVVLEQHRSARAQRQRRGVVGDRRTGVGRHHLRVERVARRVLDRVHDERGEWNVGSERVVRARAWPAGGGGDVDAVAVAAASAGGGGAAAVAHEGLGCARGWSGAVCRRVGGDGEQDRLAGPGHPGGGREHQDDRQASGRDRPGPVHQRRHPVRGDAVSVDARWAPVCEHAESDRRHPGHQGGQGAGTAGRCAAARDLVHRLGRAVGARCRLLPTGRALRQMACGAADRAGRAVATGYRGELLRPGAVRAHRAGPGSAGGDLLHPVPDLPDAGCVPGGHAAQAGDDAARCRLQESRLPGSHRRADRAHAGARCACRGARHYVPVGRHDRGGGHHQSERAEHPKAERPLGALVLVRSRAAAVVPEDVDGQAGECASGATGTACACACQRQGAAGPVHARTQRRRPADGLAAAAAAAAAATTTNMTMTTTTRGERGAVMPASVPDERIVPTTRGCECGTCRASSTASKWYASARRSPGTTAPTTRQQQQQQHAKHRHARYHPSGQKDNECSAGVTRRWSVRRGDEMGGETGPVRPRSGPAAETQSVVSGAGALGEDAMRRRRWVTGWQHVALMFTPPERHLCAYASLGGPVRASIRVRRVQCPGEGRSGGGTCTAASLYWSAGWTRTWHGEDGWRWPRRCRRQCASCRMRAGDAADKATPPIPPRPVRRQRREEVADIVRSVASDPSASSLPPPSGDVAVREHTLFPLAPNDAVGYRLAVQVCCLMSEVGAAAEAATALRQLLRFCAHQHHWRQMLPTYCDQLAVVRRFLQQVRHDRGRQRVSQLLPLIRQLLASADPLMELCEQTALRLSEQVHGNADMAALLAFLNEAWDFFAAPPSTPPSASPTVIAVPFPSPSRASGANARSFLPTGCALQIITSLSRRDASLACHFLEWYPRADGQLCLRVANACARAADQGGDPLPLLERVRQVMRVRDIPMSAYLLATFVNGIARTACARDARRRPADDAGRGRGCTRTAQRSAAFAVRLVDALLLEFGLAPGTAAATTKVTEDAPAAGQSSATRLQADATLHNAVVDAYVRCNEWSRARQYVQYHTRRSAREGGAMPRRVKGNDVDDDDFPTIDTYNILLKGMAVQTCASPTPQAVASLQRFFARQIPVPKDAITYNIMLKAGGRYGRPQRAHRRQPGPRSGVGAEWSGQAQPGGRGATVAARTRPTAVGRGIAADRVLGAGGGLFSASPGAARLEAISGGAIEWSASWPGSSRPARRVGACGEQRSARSGRLRRPRTARRAHRTVQRDDHRIVSPSAGGRSAGAARRDGARRRATYGHHVSRADERVGAQQAIGAADAVEGRVGSDDRRWAAAMDARGRRRAPGQTAHAAGDAADGRLLLHPLARIRDGAGCGAGAAGVSGNATVAIAPAAGHAEHAITRAGAVRQGGAGRTGVRRDIRTAAGGATARHARIAGPKVVALTVCVVGCARTPFERPPRGHFARGIRSGTGCAFVQHSGVGFDAQRTAGCRPSPLCGDARSARASRPLLLSHDDRHRGGAAPPRYRPAGAAGGRGGCAGSVAARMAGAAGCVGDAGARCTGSWRWPALGG